MPIPEELREVHELLLRRDRQQREAQRTQAAQARVDAIRANRAKREDDRPALS